MPDGEDVLRHRITGGGLSADILSYGAVLQDLRLAGHEPPLVLGFDEFAPYLSDSPYFGAIAGRCANRIGDGRFSIDGITYQADQNFLGQHLLHGGSKGIGKRNWRVEEVNSATVRLGISLEDGEMGFPGAMEISVTYALQDDGVFDILMTATTDKPTLCNLAHHSYWNLDGGPTTDDHILQVDADRFTAIDEAFIPTGHAQDVTGTRFDFRETRPIADSEIIDHNLCLSDAQRSLRNIGSLQSSKSGITMQMRTTEPGLQVYDGFKLDVSPPGLDGRNYAKNAGVALEPQAWPDGINHDGFPNMVLRPGETYIQHTQFAFSKG